MPKEESPTRSEARKLAAIMFTDIAGFSRQMGANEPRMLRLLETHNQLIQHAVTDYHGSVVKIMGDAFLVDFPSVVHAVQCAQAIQTQFKTYNTEREQAEQIHVRIGIHLGDIVQKDGDVFGDGVNIAARLQALAEPDTICLSQKVYEEVVKKVDLGTLVSLGRPKLKNIAEGFQVYMLLPAPPAGIRQTLRVQRLKLSRRVRPVQWLGIAGLLLVVGTLITVRYFPVLLPSSQPLTPSIQSLPLPDKPSIVVLPFDNMSKDPEQDYFSDGITEDITTGLAKISSLFVIARNSAFTYKGKAVKVQEVSREMGVQYILEGSVRRTDNQIRVTAQLIDGLTGSHVWAERFDRPLKDIFAVQDEIVQKIVTTLKLQLTLMEQGLLVRKRTDNLEAYDSYLRGIESVFRGWRETKKEANAQARQLFEHATELDPTYAEAYAWLGVTYYFDWFFGWNRTPQTLARAGELAQQATALDDALPAPYYLLGILHLWKKEHGQAIAEAQRAIALDPNNAEGYFNLGGILAFAGRSEEAIGSIEKAMRLNPRYPPHYVFQLSVAYRMAGRYEEALVSGKQALALMPNSGPTHFNLAVIYSELGRDAEARTEVAEMRQRFPNASVEVFRQFLSFKNPADVERHLDALRKAGLK
jgi:adenylate cyclase